MKPETSQMDQIIDTFDFLPKDFAVGLRIFVYVLILVHLLAFGFWCVIACPSIFKKKESFSDRVDKMIKNKEKAN